MSRAVPIGDRQIAMLTERLASRHAPDWLEQVGCSPGYRTATIWIIAGGMGLAMAGQWPAWLMLAPYAAWKLVTGVIPELLWKRNATAPRWAHDDVLLDSGDISLMEGWLSRSGAGCRVVRRGGMPKTGRQLWALMEQVVLAEELERSLRVIRENR